MGRLQIYQNGRVFDGTRLRDDVALIADAGRVSAIVPTMDLPAGDIHDLRGDLLCPTFVDLQVNGGGGVMFNDAPNEQTLSVIARAHRAAGTGTLMPTLISDTPAVTRAAIDAVANTAVPGIAGLHLEGPHLDVERAGAHKPRMIRPLRADDLDLYLDAALRLPRLLITLAPEAASNEQISQLSQAGVIVSLGHSATGYSAAKAAFAAGASMATHLFNAMGPFHHRDPGLAGAALATGRKVNVGLIADGVHVHPAMLGTAYRAKQGGRNTFLVTDAMAPFGTDMPEFALHGRHVKVDGACLTLPDGTLAGANTDLLSAARLMVHDAGVPLVAALRMVTRSPALAARLPAPAGQLLPGSPLPLRIAADLSDLKPLD